MFFLIFSQVDLLFNFTHSKELFIFFMHFKCLDFPPSYSYRGFLNGVIVSFKYVH